MKKLALFFIFLSILLLNVIGFLFYSATPSEHSSFLDFFIGRVDIITFNSAIEPAVIKKKLYRDDTVKTHPSSKAYIQIGYDSIIEDFENTEFKMAKIPEGINGPAGRSVLEIMKGTMTFFVERLQKGEEFRINTMTHTVAVRGTIFSVSTDGSRTEVTVKEGRVSVTDRTDEAKEVVLDPGEKIEITGDTLKVLKMEKEDYSLFSTVSNLTPQAGINCMPPEYIDRYFRRALGLEEKTEGIEKEKKEEETGLNKGARESAKEPADTTQTRLGIASLKANGVDEKTASDITLRLYNGLKKSRGDSVIYREVDGISKSTNRQLTGRISRLGKTILIAVNVVDSQTGKTLFSTTASYKNGESPDQKIEQLVTQINSKNGIWNR